MKFYHICCGRQGFPVPDSGLNYNYLIVPYVPLSSVYLALPLLAHIHLLIFHLSWGCSDPKHVVCEAQYFWDLVRGPQAFEFARRADADHRHPIIRLRLVMSTSNQSVWASIYFYRSSFIVEAYPLTNRRLRPCVVRSVISRQMNTVRS